MTYTDKYLQIRIDMSRYTERKEKNLLLTQSEKFLLQGQADLMCRFERR